MEEIISDDMAKRIATLIEFIQEKAKPYLEGDQTFKNEVLKVLKEGLEARDIIKKVEKPVKEEKKKTMFDVFRKKKNDNSITDEYRLAEEKQRKALKTWQDITSVITSDESWKKRVEEIGYFYMMKEYEYPPAVRPQEYPYYCNDKYFDPHNDANKHVPTLRCIHKRQRSYDYPDFGSL